MHFIFKTRFKSQHNSLEWLEGYFFLYNADKLCEDVRELEILILYYLELSYFNTKIKYILLSRTFDSKQYCLNNTGLV